MWRFWIPLVIQVTIVLMVPIPKALTRVTGQTVYLQTVPVDPYDVLRGRYVTLNYQISRPPALRDLPGWTDELKTQPEFYLILESPPSGADPTEPWDPVAIRTEYPDRLETDQWVIRGRLIDGWNVDYGLSEYYIPEMIGDDLESDIRLYPEETRAEVKVDSTGYAALVHLWVEDRRY